LLLFYLNIIAIEVKMIIVKTIEELREERKKLTGKIGFVPTMGALHKGHLSLIQRSTSENEHTVVSIFVNPTQFLKGEDLDNYPKKDAADIEICRVAKVDILFMPTKAQMYDKDELVILAPAISGYILDGASRPGHFGGMLQIVMKLLNLSKPTNAYFGKKDAQQLSLISSMVKHYFMSINIIPCEIVRDKDGLALSSRNIYLCSEDREKALSIPNSLKLATQLIISGETNCETIKQKIIEVVSGNMTIDYVEIVDRKFTMIETILPKDSIILIAARIGTTRLIDNMWV
jgi:pantoate--beta-alanine ligase